MIAESGIVHPDDVAQAAECGADGVLVGTSLLRDPSPPDAARRLADAAPHRRAPASLVHPSRAGVKVCGTRDVAAVRAATAADADMIGFVLDPRSRRSVDAATAAELIREVRGPDPVLVFRAPGPAEVRDALRVTKSTGIQLAGFDAPPDWLPDVARGLVTVIGVIHRPGSVRDALRAAEAWIAAGATHLLLEGAASTAGGRNGAWRAGGDRAAAEPDRPGRGRRRPGADQRRRRRSVTRARRSSTRRAASSEMAPPIRGGSAAFVRSARRDPTGSDRVDATGRFGVFGGRFVPETLIPALDELEAAWKRGSRGPRRTATSSSALHRDFIGRPTPLFPIPAEAIAARGGRGATIWLKREDLAHTGAHKINNAVGQALLAQRMGKPRDHRRDRGRPARRGHRDGVRPARARVRRLHGQHRHRAPGAQRAAHGACSGAEVRPVSTGNGTLRDALNEALRDWVANVEDTFYVLGSAAGPHPYPEMVADAPGGHRPRVAGPDARPRSDGCPTPSSPASGGGSNAIGIMRPFIDTRHATGRRRGRRPRRRAGRQRRVARTRCAGRAPRRVHDAHPGRRRPGRRAALGERGARLPRGRAAARGAGGVGTARGRAGHRRRGARRPRAGSRGAAGSSRHSSRRTRSPPRSRSCRSCRPTRIVLVNLSGRGDKDLGIIERELGSDADVGPPGGCGPPSTRRRPRAGPRWSPTILAGFPDRRRTRSPAAEAALSTPAPTCSRSASRSATRWRTVPRSPMPAAWPSPAAPGWRAPASSSLVLRAPRARTTSRSSS